MTAKSSGLQSVTLTFKDNEVFADNGIISRRWKLVDGLPVPTSLIAYGREWLVPDGKPGIVPPDGAPKTPFTVSWTEETTPADPVEAPSRRGVLAVVGSDSGGYLWHLQVFPETPSITCRMEFRGGNSGGETGIKRESVTAVANGLEKQDLRQSTEPERDLMERLPLAFMHTQVSAVDLFDQTDVHDNLVFERTWFMGPKQVITASTCLAIIQDPLAKAGFALLKHAPLPDIRPVKTRRDIEARNRLVYLFGNGAGREGRGYTWSIVVWQGDRWDRTAALHRLQERFRPYKPGRDGRLLSNTWGDRNRDGRLNEPFILSEIAAGSAMGVDVCQIDLGWQKGITELSTNVEQGQKGVWNGFWAADPGFWKVNPERFPNGLDRVVAEAKAKGMGIGLWFAPDSSNDFGNWEKDAAVLIDLYHEHGIRYIKVDGVKMTTRAGENNLERLFSRVRLETGGELTIDLDITAETRPGYFGEMRQGPLFLENRYTDWGGWWPHATLRNLWQLSWYIPPQRFRIEFLNPQRNRDHNVYAGSPLAPSKYPADYPFATTMVANPLAWMEVSNLPKDVAKPVATLASIWRKYRDEMHAGITLPIGDCPSGAAWTGFCSRGQGTAHVLVFRELARTGTRNVELPLPPGQWRVDPIAGSGEAVWRDNHLQVTIPDQLHWLWVRLTRTDANVTTPRQEPVEILA